MNKGSRLRHDLLIEKDVEITLRDGVRLRADVFRPKGGAKFPALINIGAYQKDKLAMTQWLVANLKPPSLKAMIPWEGAADIYRDFAYHGGIFCFGFVSNWYNNHMAHHLLGRRHQDSPDAFSKHWLWHYMRESLDTGFYCGRQARWGDIKVPLYSAGNWSGMGLHLRGNTEAFMRAASKHKKLRIHAGTHYHPFYAEEARQDQLRFRALTYSSSGMTKAGVASASWTSTALAGSLPRLGVSFETDPLPADTEITGLVNLVLWASSSTEDMDIFATIRNIGPDGNDIWEIGQQQQQVPVAKGWLRLSHRKLDPLLSLPYRPYHSHDERLWLNPGEIVQVQVEIWPTCMVFRKGHWIRLDIQPKDGVGSAPYTHYSADYNTGTNTIYTGGSVASYLLLPVVPQ